MNEKKKYILVTGASSGLGKKIAIGLSANYNVILGGRNLDRLFRDKKYCSINTGQIIFPADLSNINGLEEALHF